MKSKPLAITQISKVLVAETPVGGPKEIEITTLILSAHYN
jgi:hypothetical protein